MVSHNFGKPLSINASIIWFHLTAMETSHFKVFEVAQKTLLVLFFQGNGMPEAQLVATRIG